MVLSLLAQTARVNAKIEAIPLIARLNTMGESEMSKSKEVKSLCIGNVAGSGDKEPTTRELMEQVKTLTGLVQQLSEGKVVPSPPKERELSGAEKMCLEFQEGHSPEELEEAEKWILRQMGGRLSVDDDPVATGSSRTSGEKRIIFNCVEVTQEHRDAGITQAPDGWIITRSVRVYVLARYYLDIILDKSSYGSDEEKLRAIWKRSWEKQYHPEEFRFLFVGQPVRETIKMNSELKPLKRRRGKKKP